MTIESFFTPKSVCLIGASDNKGSVGNTLSTNLCNYKGKVFFVNPRLSGKKLFGKSVFKSITDIKENIDLAVVATPAGITYDVVTEISKTKCKNILMITSGFSEIGRTDLTEKIKQLITKEKIRLVGPNCLGIINLTNGLDVTFNSREKYELPKPGKVSIITQSGALGLAILDLASKEQLEINKFVSYGNALDIDESDLLEYFKEDKTTDTILCYIEGVRNGQKFFNTLKKVSKTKKVIILKGGVTDKGNNAVKSHTAAIAGSSKVFSAAIKQAGAVQVNTIREMFNLSKFYSWYKENKIKDIQIITNGGGFGVLTTDQLDLEKIKLSQLSESTRKEIQKKVPIYATIGNPIDLTGDADNKRFTEIINLCLKDKNTNAVVVLILLQLASISNQIPKEISEIKTKNQKPLFVLTIGGNKTEEQVKEFEKRKVLCFKDPKDLSDILRLLK